MSREELSAAAAPVLFRDRYPLPSSRRPCRIWPRLSGSPLDVVAAFHKIRMAPGHEERLHFARAYLDDVLIYSSGSKADHEAKVRRVLQALADAGLHLDPAKCEFSVQEVKYLGFIVNAGKGIACDPEKQRAIREWEAPTTVKGVRSFLGFANYYRIFIPDYAKITQSLDALLKKGTAFHWGRAENEAFQELKRRFCESPVLKQWDPSLPTFLETDCSGYALGGVLSQEGPDGRRHACAFFSKRLSPAEYNYPIHDKEMLAIMRCLDNWNAELRSCGPFTILTDHRNLKASTLPKMKVFEVADLQQLWDETVAKDSIFRAAYKAVRDRERAFPPSLGLKIQISECAIDAGKRLTFRDRIWSHDSVATGHPGREGTLAIVARRFYWPGQSQLVRRRKGFLKPLPIPDRPRSHLSMDFITDLPPTGPSKARYLWVIVDRLTKAVTLEVMDNMEAEPCANRFLQCHYRFHGMPRSIVSDRGSNWLSRFWKRFCRLAGVTQKLSTAYHPQTDGGPERMNQEIEAYLRAYVSDQDSPFFAEHGYHVDPISVEESEEPPRHREESRADSLLSRLQEVNEYMQAVMASSQQQQEEAANAKRQPAERFEVGDKVWLSMANYRSPRPCKKLDWLHHKYTVTKVISSHVVELDVRGSIYPRFHVDDAQPPPVQDESGTDLWDVDEILCARWKKRGRGEFRQALVRWTGYAEPTWEPVEWLQGTIAMKAFEDKNARTPQTPTWSEGTRG
ncbi:integrase core domain-containing protein [Hirsutella rhossiliensis]|uniref:Integrase core domain-containing protein n=1 Tax=Hirsutella rhossiliensis TaxID=111463 RepID=A0A9P8N2N1_9HYPO|nr:integrase core domain-containing protein [Hirsutella rhossiliensis]KAH0964826.1 integrase core domain-containing protein [Hirsutella rhossiliensis]